MYQRSKDGSGLHSDNSPACRYNGLKNQGVNSLNGVLQVLFLNKDFREAVKRYCSENPNTDYIDAQLNKVFDDLKKDPGDSYAVKRKLPLGVYGQHHAAWCLEEILNLTSPEASQMFCGVGLLRHRTTCGTCHHQTDEVNAFWNLPLDVMDTDTDVYNVMDGIKSLFRCTKLNGQMYCDPCCAKVDATTQTGIIDHPENLTLLLNRFEYEDNHKQYDQIKPCVWVPRTLQIEEQTYELHAVVEHHAGLTDGGFSATIKTQDDGRWYKFKDKLVVTVVDPQPFPAVMENPHLLIYQKEKTHEPDTSSSEDRSDIFRESDAPEEGNYNAGLDSIGDREVSSVSYQEERVHTRKGSNLSVHSDLHKSQDSQNMKGWRKDEVGDKKKEASKQTTAKSNCPLETNSSQTGAPANSGDSPVPKYYGLERQAPTNCSLNSVLQILFMNKDFREAVGRFCSINPKTKNTDAQLNKLFEDLKKNTADPYAVKSNLGGGAHIERDAAKYLEKILNMTSPEASQMFRGQLRHRTTYSRCHHHIDEVDPFWNLPLVMDTDTEVYSVLNGMKSFFKHSKFRGHHQMYCHQCRVIRDTTTQTGIMDHPEILTLLLKRSEYEDFLYRFDQINHRVDAPLTLQIAEGQTYELHAVVEHYGGVQSGGYTATIKSQDDGRWYKFQDRTVTLVDLQPFQAFTEKSSSPHLLIYRKEKTHGPDTSVHEVNLKSSSEDRSSICRERNRNAPEEGNDNDGLDSTEKHNGAKNKYTADRAVSSVPYQAERVAQMIGSHLSGQSGLCKSQDSQNRVSKRERIQDHGQREHETAGIHRQNLQYTDQKYSQTDYVELSCLDVKGNIGVKRNEGNRGMEEWKKDGGDKKKDASKQTTAKSNSPLEANSSQTVPKYYGLEYQGWNCSLNSVLQVLFMNKDFRETVRRFCSENPNNTKNIDAELDKVFHALKNHNASSYDVKWKLGFKQFEGHYAAEYLEKILNMTSPEASQMFGGQLRHRTTCCGPTCLHQTDEVSPFWHLSLDMDTNNEVYSVVDGIESLGRTKTSGHNQKDCHYGGKGDKTNQTGIMDHPEILTLLLNRFEYDKFHYRYKQLNRSVDVPLKLQIAENQTYELHAVVDHHGSIPSCGYWTATIKSQDDDRWYKFEDTRVTLMDPQPFQTFTERSRSAYLLMYKKEKKHIRDQDSGQGEHEKAEEDCQKLQHADQEIRQKSVSRHEDNKVVRADKSQDKDRSINMDVNKDKHRKGGGDEHVHTEGWEKRERGWEEEHHGGGQAGMAGKGGQKELKELRDGGQEIPHNSQNPGGVKGQERPHDSQKHGGVKEQERPHDSQKHGGVKEQERPHDSQKHGGVKEQERPHDSQKHGGVKEQERPHDSQKHGGVKGQERHDSQKHGGVKGQDRPYDSQKHGGVKGQDRPYDSQKHGGVKGQERQCTVQKAACDNTVFKYIKSFFSSPEFPLAACKYNGLLNQGSTCYLNSVLQVLFMTKDFREAVERHCCENPKTEKIDAQLNALFEDLKTRQSYTYEITQKMEIKEVYAQRDAAEYLEKILNMTSPEASQMFLGQLRHRTRYRTCLRHTDVVSPFWNLHLAMDTDSKVYSVMDGIRQFFTPTHFNGDNQMYCDNCDAKEDATLEFGINHPEILTLLLKRFEFNFHLMDYVKINRSVDVPTTLKISEKQTYELYGVVNHGGSMKGGHYTAEIKSQDDDRWYCFNDSSVTELYPQPFQGSMEKSSRAYVLFYRKKKEDTPSLQAHEVGREPSFASHYYEKQKISKDKLGEVTEEGDYGAGSVSTRDSVKKKGMADRHESGIEGKMESLKLTTHDDHHKGQDSQERCSQGGRSAQGEREEVGDDGQKQLCDDHKYKAVEVGEGNVQHQGDARVDAKLTQETREVLKRMPDHSEQMGRSEQENRNVSETQRCLSNSGKSDSKSDDNTGLKRDACKRTSKSLAEGPEENMANNSVQIKKEKREVK